MLVIGAVVNGWFGPPAVLFLSGLCIFYFLFQAPTWCMVNNRNGTLCRENSKGFFLGCYCRQRKWQKLKLTFVSEHWRKFGQVLKDEPLEGLKTAATLLGLLGGVITLSVAIVKITPSA